jgi:hypothetical protein
LIEQRAHTVARIGIQAVEGIERCEMLREADAVVEVPVETIGESRGDVAEIVDTVAHCLVATDQCGAGGDGADQNEAQQACGQSNLMAKRHPVLDRPHSRPQAGKDTCHHTQPATSHHPGPGIGQRRLQPV